MTKTMGDIPDATAEESGLPTSNGSLSESECWSLLGSVPLGRLSTWADGCPTIIPVQFHLDDRSIAVCLGQHTLEARSIDGTKVGFSVDGVDRSSRSGWTVQVHGIARIAERSDLWRDCGETGGGRVVHIDQPSISGTRFALCSFESSLNCLLAMGR